MLNRWGNQWVACQGEIEVAQGGIKLTWQSAIYPALEIYEELAKLFPLLTMEGGYSEYGFCIAGGVRCHGGKFTHVNKSEEFAAEIEAWEAGDAKERDDQLYADLLKFVAGEPNGITSGTMGECWAQIARKLIAEDPGLATPERRAELMEKTRGWS